MKAVLSRIRFLHHIYISGALVLILNKQSSEVGAAVRAQTGQCSDAVMQRHHFKLSPVKFCKTNEVMLQSDSACVLIKEQQTNLSSGNIKTGCS